MAEADEQKESPQNLEMLYNVPVELSVELG